MLLFWFPRVLCIGFALFLSVFALDVFDEHLTFWRTVLALLLHLAPSLFLLLILLVAWKREWIGAIAYIGFAGLYLGVVGRAAPWSVSLMVGGPPLVVGLLFIANWVRHDELRAA
jgi:hypothetical protein